MTLAFNSSKQSIRNPSILLLKVAAQLILALPPCVSTISEKSCCLQTVNFPKTPVPNTRCDGLKFISIETESYILHMLYE